MTTYIASADASRVAVPDHLPDPTHLDTGDLREVAAFLRHAEAVRTEQLAALPATALDPVTAAHRGTLERILEEVRLALSRLGEGRYGVCAGCGDAIAAERLGLRPWATSCAGCASRRR